MAPTPLKLAWVIVYLPEIARALTVYEEAFGLSRRFITPDEDYAELDTGGTTLAFAHDDLGRSNFPGGVQRAPTDGTPANVELAFVSEDVDGAVASALAAGCTLLAEPTVKPHGQTVAWVRDPWGTLIELATPIG